MTNLALARPSDGGVTRRIAAYIRRPWSREEPVNVLAGKPHPAAGVVAWLNFEDVAVGVSGGGPNNDEPERTPSRTRPAAWAPRPSPARPVKAPPRRKRSWFGWLRWLAGRVAITVEVRRDHWRRLRQYGPARSARWGGAA